MSDTSSTPSSGELINEPPNSTVDDWHGQEVQRDTDAAERALAETGGDMAAAEKVFEQERPEHPSEEFKVDASEREGTLDGGAAAGEHPTGEAQAARNREVDPPA